MNSIFKNNNGFTLLELIIVVSIIGISLSLAVPGLKEPYGKYNLEAAAYNIAEGIRLHMQQAVNAQDTMSTYRIKFDVDNEKYYFQKNTAIVNTVTISPSVDLVATNFDWDSNGQKDHVLAFNISGNPYPRGGTVTLQDRLSGQFLYVIIANVTGRVRVDSKPPSSGYE